MIVIRCDSWIELWRQNGIAHAKKIRFHRKINRASTKMTFFFLTNKSDE